MPEPVSRGSTLLRGVASPTAWLDHSSEVPAAGAGVERTGSQDGVTAAVPVATTTR